MKTLSNYEKDSFTKKSRYTWVYTIIAMILVLTVGGGVRPVLAQAQTIDEAEPRTPISSLPYIITQPGSYYLTSDLTMTTDVNGITVDANHVTIDLMGFSLIGPGQGYLLMGQAKINLGS